jgi:hypothetical protein
MLASLLLALLPLALAQQPKHSLDIDFSTYNPKYTTVRNFLAANGLRSSSSFVLAEPYTHTFTPANLDIKNGALHLKVTGVDGYKNGSSIPAAEVSTIVDNMLYGNMTMEAKLSNVAGVCSCELICMG